MYSVGVLLSTYNGELYLEQQIQSVLQQEDVDVYLYIRDDGSSDNTCKILSRYKNDKIYIYKGNNIGYARSFWKLLLNAAEHDYYCFCDQDDVWGKRKVINEINRLEKVNEKNKFCCTSMTVVDENLNIQYINRFKKLKLSLGSSIVRQRIAGCTMVFDSGLREMLLKCNLCEENLNLSHDMAVYAICCMTGGTPVYLDSPDILYRRHSDAVTSYGKGLLKRVSSYLNVFKKDAGRKYAEITYLYNIYSNDLTYDSRKLVQSIIKYKDNWFNTLKLFFNSSIKSNVLFLDVITKVAILARKL